MKTRGTTLTMVALLMVFGLSTGSCFAYGLFGQGDRDPGPDAPVSHRPVQTSVLRIGLGGEQLFPEYYRERESLAQAYRVNCHRMQSGQPHHDPRQIAQRYQQVDRFLKSIPVSNLVLLNGRQLTDRRVNELVQRLRTDSSLRGKTYAFR